MITTSQCIFYLVDFLVVPVRVDVSQFGGDAVVLPHHDRVMGDQHHLLIGPAVAYIGPSCELERCACIHVTNPLHI